MSLLFLTIRLSTSNHRSWWWRDMFVCFHYSGIPTFLTSHIWLFFYYGGRPRLWFVSRWSLLYSYLFIVSYLAVSSLGGLGYVTVEPSAHPNWAVMHVTGQSCKKCQECHKIIKYGEDSKLSSTLKVGCNACDWWKTIDYKCNWEEDWNTFDIFWRLVQLIWIWTNIANPGDERICRSKLVSNQNDLQAGFPHLSKQQLLIGLKWGDEWTYCGSGITWQGMPCTWAPPPTPGFSQKYNFDLSDYRDGSQLQVTQELGEVFAKSLED